MRNEHREAQLSSPMSTKNRFGILVLWLYSPQFNVKTHYQLLLLQPVIGTALITPF